MRSCLQRFVPRRCRLLGVGLLGVVFGWSRVAAGEDPAPLWRDATFEELANITITTASKHEEPLFRSAAAVSVLTGDEVRRTGAFTLPDALRYVPGMDVARITSQAWGVGARGFGGQFANQLLVLIDGRSVYEPSFGGVFWETRDVFMPDLDRIEVVRGPGGSLWGANAVNGVINILSKDARETQGTLIYGGTGNENSVMAGLRQGFQVSPHTYARVYASQIQFDASNLAGGMTRPDAWSRTQVGFRLDSQRDASVHATLQGNITRAPTPNPFTVPTFTPPDYSTRIVFDQVFTAANLLGRWTKEFSPESVLSLQGYWDYKDISPSAFQERRQTIDLEAQHNVRLGERHFLNYGLGYRAMPDRIAPTVGMRIPGAERAYDDLYKLFGQDEIELVKDRSFLTLGAKIEHNDYSGWEVQPSVRWRWHPAENQTVWAAVSRAVATPSRGPAGIEVDLLTLPPGALGPGTPATLEQVQGRVDRSEKLLAYEFGYRVKPNERLSLDFSAFYNRYSDLQALRLGAPNFAGTPPVLPLYWENAAAGETCGMEGALAWQALENWRLQASYSYFESNVSQASLGRAAGGGSPRHKFALRSLVEFGPHWEWDAGVRFVDDLPAVNVPSYLELDLRLAWKPSGHWELALVGQNLLHDHHSEHPPGLTPTLLEISRSVSAKVTWKY